MSDVLRLQDTGVAPVAALLARYGLQLELVPAATAIPGSYWHEEEAGIIGLKVLADSIPRCTRYSMKAATPSVWMTHAAPPYTPMRVAKPMKKMRFATYRYC